ncbi:hypothetical protein JYU34_013965 [Plutella xylostella]|uniref:Uncharacterized protein n=1 Tax=Plutella xylostella TaxID=51655 RepID=A0ABQ7QC21_PLUXY|nr:hypothetical protein JYU34_013965 [Plutella xylostella]
MKQASNEWDRIKLEQTGSAVRRRTAGGRAGAGGAGAGAVDGVSRAVVAARRRSPPAAGCSQHAPLAAWRPARPTAP